MPFRFSNPEEGTDVGKTVALIAIAGVAGYGIYKNVTKKGKRAGDEFGADMVFEHIGGVQSVWVGIGIAYGEAMGHNPPFAYAMKQVTTNLDSNWVKYDVSVTGIIPTNILAGRELDAQRFVSDTMPVSGQQPPNPFGVNNWDEKIYSTA